MLFKALLRRLNGGTDTASTKASSSYRSSSQLVYQRFPNLQALLLRLLDNGLNSRSEIFEAENHNDLDVKSTNAQSVFAAFEIIERSGIPPAYEADVRNALWRYAGSPSWSIREKAAKASSLVVDDRDIEKEVTALLVPHFRSQNILHGRLLCLRSLIGRTETPQIGGGLGERKQLEQVTDADRLVADMYERLLSSLDDHFKAKVECNPCVVTAAAFIDCLAELFKVLVLSSCKWSEIQIWGLSNAEISQSFNDVKV